MRKQTTVRQCRIPVELDKVLRKYVEDNGMTYSGLMLVLLKKYASEKGIIWDK